MNNIMLFANTISNHTDSIHVLSNLSIHKTKSYVFWHDTFSITSFGIVKYNEITYGNVQEFMDTTK